MAMSQTNRVFSLPPTRLMRGFGTVVVLGLLAAGCASSSGTTGDDSSTARQMFVAGFEDIEAVYIDKPDIGALAIAGLQQLTVIDPDLTARRSADKIELMLNNQIAYSTNVDDDFDAEDWGELTSDVLEEAAVDSELVKAAPSERVFEAMFSGIVAKLDQFSRYASVKNAREN